MTKPVLNIIGTGKLGTVLGRLLADHSRVTIGALFSRNPENARNAARFIGAGNPTERLENLENAEIWLLSVADDAIEGVANRLAKQIANWRGNLVFHCSGLHDSGLLAPLAQRGAETASFHPVLSFSDKYESLKGFPGVYCTLEGSASAETQLRDLFAPPGARIVPVEREFKPLYHAATTIACNHLVALLDSGLKLLDTAGIAEPVNRELLGPLVRSTVENTLRQGPQGALTGPVARGDSGTIETQVTAIAEKKPEILDSYLSLCALTLDIATAHGANAGHRRIAAILQKYSDKPYPEPRL